MESLKMITVLTIALCMLLVFLPAEAMWVRSDALPPKTPFFRLIFQAQENAAFANNNYLISVEQARNSVRLFINNLSLEPELASTGSLEIGNYYFLNTGSNNFWVNQNSGIVEFAHFGAAAPNSANITVTRDEAYTKAAE